LNRGETMWWKITSIIFYIAGYISFLDETNVPAFTLKARMFLALFWPIEVIVIKITKLINKGGY